jgi:hypothetical protein
LRVLGDAFDIPESGNVPITLNLQAEYDTTEGHDIEIVAVNSESGTYAV